MLIHADARMIPLRDGCVDCVVTSPPYWGLRDYGSSRQIGLEPSPDAYVQTLVRVFADVWRVLKDEGSVWLNLGDSYAGSGCGYGGSYERERPAWRSGATDNQRNGPQANRNGLMAVNGCKPKDLVGIPWRVAFALQADGWYLRSDIIWSKPNPMPESVTDRPTKAHEYLFLLTKSERYYYDAAAIAESVSEAMRYEIAQGYDGLGLKDYDAAGVQNPSSVKARIIANARTKQDGHGRRYEGFNARWDKTIDEYQGKHADADASTASRRMLLNVKAARANGHPHDTPFGLTRNKRTVWEIPTQPYTGAHFATMPEALVEPCILAGCPLGGLVLDPFIGSGTVGAVAERLGRRWVGVDLNQAYHELAKVRTAQRGLRFTAADKLIRDDDPSQVLSYS